jgi:hypothetical protein
MGTSQRVHLVVVHPMTARTLVYQNGPLWMWPSHVTAGDRKTAEAVETVARSVELPGEIVCVVGSHYNQARNEIDRYCVLRAVSDAGPSSLGLVWREIKTLTARSALSPDDAWALANCIEPLLVGPQASFRAWTWRDEVDAWVDARLAGSGAVRCGRSTTYNATPSDVTIGYDTTSGRVYFKGTTRRPFVEAGLTQRLAAMRPRALPETVAYDAGRGWWLTRDVGGEPIRGKVREDCASHLGSELALLQIASMHLDRREIGIGDDEPLQCLASRVCALLDSASVISRAERECVRARTVSSIEALARCNYPCVWNHMDLQPENMFATHSSVAFIDLENPWFGPPASELVVLKERALCHIEGGTAWYQAVCDQFRRTWRVHGLEVDASSLHLAAIVAVLRAVRQLEAISRAAVSGEIAGFEAVGSRRVFGELAKRIGCRAA